MTINASFLPADLRGIFQRQVLRAGANDDAVRQLVVLGLRTLLITEPLMSGRTTAARATPIRGVDVLRELLAPHGISIESIRSGRPLTVTIRSTEGRRLLGEADDGVEVGEDAIEAAVYVAAHRSAGSALFFVGTFKSEKRTKTTTHPQLVFLVLTEDEEHRAWVVTRKELRAVDRRLAAGGKAAGFLSTASGVRIALPRRSSGLDLAHRVLKPVDGSTA